jgi:DNA polymerase III alpha subunit (gram-positive type)
MIIYVSVRGDQIPHITQIAAVEMSNGSTFNKYVIQIIPITSAVENVTKIIMVNEKVMAVDGVTVKPVPLHVALNRFLSWLETFDNIYIIAHNGRRFDFIVLTAAYKVCGLLPNFCQLSQG